MKYVPVLKHVCEEDGGKAPRY